MRRFLPALRSLLAIVAGYLAIALGTVLVLELLLGGVGWGKSSPTQLAVAILGTVLSGLAGGWVAARVAGRQPFRHAAGVLVPLALDTIYVITSGVSTNPVWFDLGGSLTLMAASVLAGYLIERRARQPRPATVTA